MRAEYLAVIAIVLGAVFFVRQIEDAPAENEALETGGALSLTTHSAAPETSSIWGGAVRIKAGPDRQFYVEAEVNGHTARFLVDTGATFVALRQSDADNAGVYTGASDFTYPVRTANGETRAALVMLDEVEIDGLLVTNLQALILRDDQLAINLLGMSFLSRLESVEARRGEMLLKG